MWTPPPCSSLSTHLGAAALCLLLSSMALLMLAWMPTHSSAPLPLVVLLGASHGCTQSLIWVSLTLAAPAHLLNLVGGLLGAAVNVLPALLPAVALMGEDSRVDVTILAAVGLAGVGCFSAAVWLTGDAEDGDAEDADADRAGSSRRRRAPPGITRTCSATSSEGSDCLSCSSCGLMRHAATAFSEAEWEAISDIREAPAGVGGAGVGGDARPG